MNTMKRNGNWGPVAQFVAVLVALSLCFAAPAAAQSKAKEEKVTSKAEKGSAAGNIKSGSEKNDPKSMAQPPADRGGSVRGGGPWPCYVRIENWTPWKAIVYVDGHDMGVVPHHGDLLVRTGNGASSTYAEAIFSDGSVLHWGPHVFNCVSSVGYLWQFTN